MTDLHLAPLVFNTTVAKHSNLAIEIDIARRNGFVGLETTAAKIRSYLDAGFSTSDLETSLGGLPLYGIGALCDIERHGDDLPALESEARALFELARRVGARAVQVITGPLDFREVVRFRKDFPKTGYRGVLEYCDHERLSITTANLRMLADMARSLELIVYIEALAWTPLNTIEHQVRMLRDADRDNLKMVVDFWHCHASGDGPENVARIDKDLIYGVHVDDALPSDGSVPDEVVLRDVPTGEGILDLKAWTDAVRSTGYDGWWCPETFSRKLQQENSYEVAARLKAQIEGLLAS